MTTDSRFYENFEELLMEDERGRFRSSESSIRTMLRVSLIRLSVAFPSCRSPIFVLVHSVLQW